MVFVRLLTVNLSVKVKPTEERKKSATPDSLAKRVKEVLKLSHHVKAPTRKGQPWFKPERDSDYRELKT